MIWLWEGWFKSKSPHRIKLNVLNSLLQEILSTMNELELLVLYPLMKSVWLKSRNSEILFLDWITYHEVHVEYNFRIDLGWRFSEILISTVLVLPINGFYRNAGLCRCSDLMVDSRQWPDWHELQLQDGYLSSRWTVRYKGMGETYHE